MPAERKAEVEKVGAICLLAGLAVIAKRWAQRREVRRRDMLLEL